MSAAPAPVIGYTAGVFDLFHIGHLNLLRNARACCDFLVVGVTVDEVAAVTRGAPPVVPLVERLSIVQHVRYVDHVVPQVSMDKLAAWKSLRFDRLFVGDNVKGTPYWQEQERRLAGVSVPVVYLSASRDESGAVISRGADDLPPDLA